MTLNVLSSKLRLSTADMQAAERLAFDKAEAWTEAPKGRKTERLSARDLILLRCHSTCLCLFLL